MKKIKVGYARLYNAKGCSILGGTEFVLTFLLGDIEVLCTLGPKFRYLVMTGTFKPENIDKTAAPTRARKFKFPSPEIFPADTYTEMVATKNINVNDHLAGAFLKQDKTASNEILKIVEDSKQEFAKALDYAAGILGIRYNHLLVRIPITEQFFAHRGKNIPYSFQSGIKITTLLNYKLDVSENNKGEPKKMAGRLNPKWSWNKASVVLGWMLRAWKTEDDVLKFVSFFTALECVIPGITKNDINKFTSNKNTLIAMVEENVNMSQKEAILSFLKELKNPIVPLSNRFEQLASSANLPGWEKDLKAFNKFSRMRNLLLHQGKSEVELKVEVEAKDILNLEDIVKRYVNFSLFANTN